MSLQALEEAILHLRRELGSSEASEVWRCREDLNEIIDYILLILESEETW